VNNKSKSKNGLDKEIESYEIELSKNIEPLKYWEQNENTYPILFYCVKTIFCIPGSSVPMGEQLFSYSENTVKKSRTRLASERVNKMMMVIHGNRK
jgi:hypothetical protein